MSATLFLLTDYASTARESNALSDRIVLDLIERVKSEGWAVRYVDSPADLPEDHFRTGCVSWWNAGLDSREVIVERIADRLIADVASTREPRSALFLDLRVFDSGFWGASWSY